MKRLLFFRDKTATEPSRRKRTLLAAYGTLNDVEAAVGGLILAGLPSEKISILIPEQLGKETVCSVHEELLNGPAGLLDALGVMSMPGLGRFIAAGPFQKAMTGVDGEVLRGAVLAFLAPVRDIGAHVVSGRALVSVECDGIGWAVRARQIFGGTNAESLSFVWNRSAAAAPGAVFGAVSSLRSLRQESLFGEPLPEPA